MPKEFLKMADMFFKAVEPSDFSLNTPSVSVYMDDGVSPHEYAAHAINSHDELVRLRDELLAALEAHERFWTIREAELGELSPEAKAVRDSGLAAIAAAKEAEQ